MTTILATDDYRLSSTCAPVPLVPGLYHLVITSQLLTAKNPTEQRKVYSLTGTAPQLTALADSIHRGLA